MQCRLLSHFKLEMAGIWNMEYFKLVCPKQGQIHDRVCDETFVVIVQDFLSNSEMLQVPASLGKRKVNLHQVIHADVHENCLACIKFHLYACSWSSTPLCERCPWGLNIWFFGLYVMLSWQFKFYLQNLPAVVGVTPLHHFPLPCDRFMLLGQAIEAGCWSCQSSMLRIGTRTHWTPLQPLRG